MKFDNQLRYAVKMVESYKHDMPLAAWLKTFFRLHPQMGSKDRRRLSDLVYSYYRTGRALQDLPMAERILAGAFLCSDQPTEMLRALKPAWNDDFGLSAGQKFSRLSLSGSLEDIFPWKDHLSVGVDFSSFLQSLIRKPDLFVRIRPGHEKAVMDRLTQSGWPHERLGPQSIRLASGSKVDQLFQVNREVVIQDFSSQRTAELMVPALLRGRAQGPEFSVWDCCAGAGGKALMVQDMLPDAKLTVTDIRPSILKNLDERFAQAGIHGYQRLQIDLSRQRPGPATAPFDLIVADVPCSGSGTWGRNPEHLYFFGFEDVHQYQALQRQIVSNCVPQLAPGGVLVYITCSVFEQENEAVMDFIQGQLGMRLIEKKLLAGYDLRADTLFAAAFTCGA